MKPSPGGVKRFARSTFYALLALGCALFAVLAFTPRFGFLVPGDRIAAVCFYVVCAAFCAYWFLCEVKLR